MSAAKPRQQPPRAQPRAIRGRQPRQRAGTPPMRQGRWFDPPGAAPRKNRTRSLSKRKQAGNAVPGSNPWASTVLDRSTAVRPVWLAHNLQIEDRPELGQFRLDPRQEFIERGAVHALPVEFAGKTDG